jgi:hypothetical protein
MLLLLLRRRRRQQMILRTLLILLPTHQYHNRNNPTLRPARAAPRADAGDKRTITVLRVSAALLLPPPGSCSTCTCARHSKYNKYKYTILVTHMSTRGVTKTGTHPQLPRRVASAHLNWPALRCAFSMSHGHRLCRSFSSPRSHLSHT